MSDQPGIYRIVNIVSGRTYIGSSSKVRTRLHEHRRNLKNGIHPSVHLQRTCNKYGLDAFMFEPLVSCAVTDLLVREQKFIDAYRDHDLPIYNLLRTAKSTTGFTFKHSEATRAKMRGRIVSPEQREHYRRMYTGRSAPEEVKAKLRAIRGTPEARLKNSLRRIGKKASPEARAKMSIFQRSVKHTAERHKKIGLSNKGKKRTMEQSARMSRAQKQRFQIITQQNLYD